MVTVDQAGVDLPSTDAELACQGSHHLPRPSVDLGSPRRSYPRPWPQQTPGRTSSSARRSGSLASEGSGVSLHHHGDLENRQDPLCLLVVRSRLWSLRCCSAVAYVRRRGQGRPGLGIRRRLRVERASLRGLSLTSRDSGATSAHTDRPSFDRPTAHSVCGQKQVLSAKLSSHVGSHTRFIPLSFSAYTTLGDHVADIATRPCRYATSL